MTRGVPRAAGTARGRWRWPALAMFAVGYGANHFVPLLAVYRRELALTDADATAVFGVYALGLIPGFLIGGPASDRYGRRRIMLAFTALSLIATTVLITGRAGPAGLYAGRLLTGVVSGTVFTVGTAWIKELSEGGTGVAARRAALALTAGFGVGPLVSGVLAQWAPEPTVLPYLVHLVIGVLALALLPRSPETHRPAARGPLTIIPRAALTPRFRRVVAPMAPFVFGSVTLAFTTLPADGAGPPRAAGIVFTGALAAVALAAGLAGQRWGRRMLLATSDQPTGRDSSGPASVRPAITGLAVVIAGYLLAALATARPAVVTATTAALVLGCGYGICLVTGLREVEQLATPQELGSLVAVYYSLTYCGLAIPYLLALTAPHLGYPPAVLVVAAAAALTLLVVAINGRRP